MSEDRMAAGKRDAPARHQELVQLDLDVAALAGALGQRLYQAGMSVTPAQSQQYAMSLQLIKPSTRRELYFMTKSIFVTDAAEIATLDRVFAQIFGPSGSPSGAYDNEAVAYAAPTAG